MKKVLFGLTAVIAGAGAAYAANGLDGGNACALIQSMMPVFNTLRTLAFIGAAFLIAGWAWGYISKPADVKIEDIKDKGIGLLVGFALLFGIGLVLQFLPGITDCVVDNLNTLPTGY